MKREVYQLLENLRLDYTCLEHSPIMTMEEGVAIAQKLDVTPCKNLFLVNKQKEYFLVMVLGDKKISIKNIARQIGSSHLSFASNEDLNKYLCTIPGGVSILGLIYDKENKVKLLIDKDILETNSIGCHPCENSYSIKLSTKDVIEILLPAINHSDFEEITSEDY